MREMEQLDIDFSYDAKLALFESMDDYVAVVGASSTYLHGKPYAYAMSTSCQWNDDILMHSRFYVFILYGHVWILLYLSLFTILAWRLNASYWKDIK